MVIDAVMEELFGKRYDRDGKVAASGRVLDGVIAQLLRARFSGRSLRGRRAARNLAANTWADFFNSATAPASPTWWRRPRR
jgi:1,6-anhydro-N-acetylmuramate kinase